MKKFYIIKYTITFLLIILIILITCLLLIHFNPAYATILKSGDHAYATQREDTTYGGYFYNPYGQSDLHSNYTGQEFITNEMWCGFDDTATSWIEIGDVDGDINGNYWAGHFFAKQDHGSYAEYTIGSNYSTSGHSFKIKYSGYGQYLAYIDGNQVASLYMPYSKFLNMTVGIETNCTTSYFTRGMYNTGLQILDSNNNWINWSNPYNLDRNNFGWYSEYNSSLNRITYSY